MTGEGCTSLLAGARRRIPDPAEGDRGKLTCNGKFLPYRTW
jgi:cyanate lyase